MEPVHDLCHDARRHSLTPYSAATFLTLGALLSCFIWNVYFMKKPLVGEPVSFSGFFSRPATGHLLGLLGGAIWGSGTVFNLAAGKLTGQAISYAIGQSAPMVAALWGVLAWKEFAGSGSARKGLSRIDVRLLRLRDIAGSARKRLKRDTLINFLYSRARMLPVISARCRMLFPFDPGDEQLQEPVCVRGKANLRIRLQIDDAFDFVVISM